MAVPRRRVPHVIIAAIITGILGICGILCGVGANYYFDHANKSTVPNNNNYAPAPNIALKTPAPTRLDPPAATPRVDEVQTSPWLKVVQDVEIKLNSTTFDAGVLVAKFTLKNNGADRKFIINKIFVAAGGNEYPSSLISIGGQPTNNFSSASELPRNVPYNLELSFKGIPDNTKTINVLGFAVRIDNQGTSVQFTDLVPRGRYN